jgi:hypothetical protein
MASKEHWRLGVDVEQGEVNPMARDVDGYIQAKYALAERIIGQLVESVTASSKGVTGVLGTSDQPAATK